MAAFASLVLMGKHPFPLQTVHFVVVVELLGDAIVLVVVLVLLVEVRFLFFVTIFSPLHFQQIGPSPVPYPGASLLFIFATVDQFTFTDGYCTMLSQSREIC